jgi:hypothetical protein
MAEVARQPKESNEKGLSKISQKFINGLKEYELTMEQAQKDFKYCGGDGGVDRRKYTLFLQKKIQATQLLDKPNRHLNYWMIANRNIDLPDCVENCICGHFILENCYIENITTGEVLVLGNCCIKRFIPKSGRTCAKCGNPHRRRKINLCFDCSSGRCSNCGVDCNPSYKTCWGCYRLRY